MSWEGLEAALLARLSGKPADYVPPLYAPSDAVGRYPESFVVLGGDKIPLFNPGADGADTETVFPSIGYDVSSVEPRYDMFHRGFSPSYGAERIKVPVPGSEQLVDGVLVPRMDSFRDPGAPMTFMVELRAYCRTNPVMATLVNYLYSTFPPRGFIRVPFKDGTYRSWNMLFSAFQDLDKREATVSGLTEREYCKVLTYKVEGYLDTSDTARYRNRINTFELT